MNQPSTTQNSAKKTSTTSKDCLNAPKIHLHQVRTERARRNFKDFVVQAWPILEPSSEFLEGTPVDAICTHLQAVTEGRIAHLIINVPPGHAKSLLTAVFWPAWVWINHPETRWLFSSYREPLATRDSVKCRRLIESDWYQQRWGARYQLTGDQNQKTRFENTATGYRVVVPVHSGTGERGDYVVVDDPHSVTQAESDLERRGAIEWWNGSMATRLNDLSTGHKVVVQQRVHEADLTGDLTIKGGYELLCLPAEFEPERRCSTSIGWTDPRKDFGDLLWPARFSRTSLEGLKVSLGSYRYAGQFQQRPSPSDGGICKRFWWRYWRPAHLDLPPVQVQTDGEVLSIQAVPVPAQFDTMIQSWDMAFKDLATSDYVVGQVWGALKADRFLLDQCRARMDMPSTKEAVKQLTERWPKTGTKLVEDKANGPAIIQELKHDVAGLTEVNPEGGKIARAHAVSSQIESGNVYLPHPAIAPWIVGFIDEAAAFPAGRNDDQVDAMTQALNRLRSVHCGFFIPDSHLTEDPFAIPDAWPRAFGMSITRVGVAALWGARDDAGTIHIYAEHLRPHAEPSENARAVKALGAWIPGVINSSSITGSQIDRDRLRTIYRQQGLNIQVTNDGDEIAIYELWQLLAANKIKVFASLSGFLSEYRVNDEQSPLLLCLHSLIVSGRNRMKTKPAERVIQPRSSYGCGERGWMA
jgi:predicted phage terminase large subunit-like protein